MSPLRWSTCGRPAWPSPDWAHFFSRALIAPVLTAHPTEVQRKSILDCQREVARLLAERDRAAFTPEEQRGNEDALRRMILTLWQTRILRTTRLTVNDEIENGLAYYRYTFLRELPHLCADLEDLAGNAPRRNRFPAAFPAASRQLDRRRP